MTSDYSCFHFTQCNPHGENQDNLPALLRRVADTVEQLGVIEPSHMVMEVEINEYGFLPVITLYYWRPDEEPRQRHLRLLSTSSEF